MSKVAKFVTADAHYLSHADCDELSVGDIYWDAVVWVKTTAQNMLGPGYGILCKQEGAPANNFEYRLCAFGALRRLTFSVRNTANNATITVTDTHYGTMPADTWCMVHVYHDPVANVIGIDINAGMPDTAANTGGVRDNTLDFKVGTYTQSFTDGPWEGDIGPLATWKPTDTNLTAAQLIWLYRGGYGRNFSELDAGMLAGLQTWWEMVEPTGTRVDSMATADLAESGVVSSEESLLGIPTTLLGV